MFGRRILIHPKQMYSIQRLGSAHIPRCLEILKSNFDIPWKELDTIMNAVANKVEGIFIKDTLVGFIAISTIIDESEILMCAVDPAYHKQGFASALVQLSLNQLKALNTAAVFLEVDTHNLPAKRLYTKFGFQTIGHRKAYYLQSSGSYNDAIIMRLAL